MFKRRQGMEKRHSAQGHNRANVEENPKLFLKVGDAVAKLSRGGPVLGRGAAHHGREVDVLQHKAVAAALRK